MTYNPVIRFIPETVDFKRFKHLKPNIDKAHGHDYMGYVLIERKPNGENNILYSTNNREEYEKFLKENGYGFIQ